MMMPHRHLTSLLLAFVLLLQAILPFAVLLRDDEASRALGQKILICAGATSRWVSWQELEKGNAPAHQTSHEPSCVLCLPTTAHSSADAAIPVLTAHLTNIILTTSTPFTAPQLRAERFAAEHPSRAPPRA